MFLEIQNLNEARLFPETLEEMMGMRSLRMESERNRQAGQASVVLTRKIRDGEPDGLSLSRDCVDRKADGE